LRLGIPSASKIKMIMWQNDATLRTKLIWYCFKTILLLLFLLLPLALQPVVGFGLSNSSPPFCSIYHQLSPSSHSQHLISFYFFSLFFPGPSPSFRPFQFLSEDLFGYSIFHSLPVTQPTYPLPLYPFYYIFSFTHLF
jgi:hypothetical protein